MIHRIARMNRWMSCSFALCVQWRWAVALCFVSAVLAAVASAAPKVIVISLDGATPRLVDQYMANGALNPTQGLGLLQNKGIRAERNTTISPSLTAPGHIAIAT